jgi:transcriptional/translational regulatory protein YebC/TACO1
VEEEVLLGVALEAGAEDVTESDDVFEIVTQPEDFAAVRESIENGKIPVASAEVAMIPKTTMKLDGKEAEQTLSLIEDLEDHDDIQSVAANFDIPDEILEKAG